MKTVFMFPGQGSQSIGMMQDLLEEYALARDVFARASNAIDIDLAEIAAKGPEEQINSTAITQPIVMTASLAMWQVWNECDGFQPDAVCGHSLGEYTALVVSGVLPLEEAVKLVHLRGQLMQEAVPHGEGAMAALLGLDDQAVIDVCAKATQGEVVSAANFNAPGQVVISGATEALQRAITLAKEAGARRAALLPVSVPCHCSLLQPAGERLAEAIDAITFAEPQIPVIQNVGAKVPGDLAELKKNLLAHLYSPVQWSESIQNLAEQGAELFVECGPGKVLTGLNKRIVKSAKTLNMQDAESMQVVLDEGRSAE